ncbi:hypothetical protein QCE63_01660 [Caballeronia sp. LZ065]|uniref:hypothetical protein n=1 Tax=Caballeronia sp. LZ065 TaxID=3038571 RepID=UPI002862BB40|nr:hypothetical protein [Caballeronia sp. LZ065]MDR5778133.1 hypothetical protein [Caballeronia sp. LZ065]
MAGSSIEGKAASWKRLARELGKRSREPLGHFSFVSYFVVAVFIFGGAGIWTELRSYLYFVPTAHEPLASLASLRTAVITFFPALAGSSCMQLIWAEDHERSLRAFAIVVLAALIVAIFFITPEAVSDRAALVVGAAASVLALWSWWIANAKQQDLLDPDAATGGKAVDGDLPGSLDQFNT